MDSLVVLVPLLADHPDVQEILRLKILSTMKARKRRMSIPRSSNYSQGRSSSIKHPHPSQLQNNRLQKTKLAASALDNIDWFGPPWVKTKPKEVRTYLEKKSTKYFIRNF